MESSWIHDLKDFLKIRDDWDLALETSEADNPFLLSEFIVTWWQINHQGNDLCIFILKNNEKIFAGFPLYISRNTTSSFGLKRIQQIGDNFANLTEPFSIVELDKFEFHFINSLKKLKNWEFLDLPRIRSGFFERYREKNKVAGLRMIVFKDNLNASIIIDRNSEDYLMTVSSNLRNNVRKARKKAKKLGEIVLNKIEAIKDIENLYNKFILFSIESRHNRGSSSEFIDKMKQEFTKKLLIRFSSKGLLDAHALFFGETLAAISFGFRYKKGFKWIFTSYNPDLHNISPGHTLIFELVNYCYQRGDSYFDTYAGGQVFYKKQWCNKFDSLYHFMIFNNNIKAILYFPFIKIRLKFLKFVLTNSRIHNYYFLLRKKLIKMVLRNNAYL